MDWTAFEAWLRADGFASLEVGRHREAAAEIVAELGDEPAPKHVDALVARREAGGASVAELAALKRAGDDLVRFQRRERPVGAPDEGDAAPGTTDSRVGDERASLAALYAGTSATAAAAIPVAALLREHDRDHSGVIEWLRRYGWVLHVVTLALGLALWYARFRMSQPYDVTIRPIARAIGWVGSMCVIVGAAGLLRRTDWLDWDALVGDTPIGRMVRRQRTWWALHTTSVVVGLALLPFALAAHPPAGAEPSELRWGGQRSADEAGWARRLRADVPVSPEWQFDAEATRETAGWETASFTSAEGSSSTLVVATSSPPITPDQRASFDRAVALSTALAPELGVAAAGLRCERPRAPPHVDTVCAHEGGAPGPSFVLVCQASPFLQVCAAWSGIGATNEARDMLARLTANTHPRIE